MWTSAGWSFESVKTGLPARRYDGPDGLAARTTAQTVDNDGLRTSLWRRAEIRWLVMLTSLGFTSFFLTLAALPYWAAEAGVPIGAAGLVTTVMLAATVAVQTVVPTLVRRAGTTRVLATGIVLLSAAAPLYLLRDGLAWMLLVSAVRGAGFAIVTVVTVTLFGVLVPDPRRGEAVGIYGLAVSVPNLIAVPAGTALTVGGRFDLVVYLTAAPSLIVLMSRRMARDLTSKTSGSADPPPSRRASRATFAALAPALVLSIVCVPATGLITFLPIEAPDGALAATALLAFGVAALLVRWRIGRIADRKGVGLPMVCSLAAVAIGMIVVAAGLMTSHASADFAVLVGITVAGLGYGGIQNLSLVAAFRRAGSGGAMTASAVWNVAFDTGIGVGAVTVGVLAEGWGIPTTYLFCAALVVAAVPLARVAARPASGGPR